MKITDENDELVLNKSSETDKSYRKELDDIVEEWNKYRRALRGEERDTFDKIIDQAKSHTTAGNKQNHYKPIETFFISVILEQQMEIMRLKRKLEGHAEVDEEY